MGILGSDFTQWLTVDACARSIGVSAWWIRERIASGHLPATAISTGKRKILRIHPDDWRRFRARYTGPATNFE